MTKILTYVDYIIKESQRRIRFKWKYEQNNKIWKFDKINHNNHSRNVISDASEKEALLEDRSGAQNGLFYLIDIYIKFW